MASSRLHHLIAAALPAAILSLVTTAHADSGARLDAEVNAGSTAYSDTSLTLGGGALFGYRLETPKVWIQPELGVHYTAITSIGCSCSGLSHVVRGVGGARIGAAGLISNLIEPSIFGHVGYGWLGASVTELVTSSALAADMGLSLDARATGRLRVGVHGAYNALKLVGKRSSAPGEPWISVGLHLGMLL